MGTCSESSHLSEQPISLILSLLSVGDSGYPLQPWLLTPVQEAGENSPESRYNSAHIRARNSIEKCFGVLKARFRCLLKHRTLHYDAVKAANIIYACMVFHNIIVENRPPEVELILADNNEPLEPVVRGVGGQCSWNILCENEELQINIIISFLDVDGGWLAEGRRIRTNLIRRDFVN